MRIICLANSFKHAGRCLAGIDLETGQWVRPVTGDGGPIPIDAVTISGAELKPLDIVELEVGPTRGLTRFQRENRPLLSPVRRVDRAPVRTIGRYCEVTEQLLHSPDDRVAPAHLESLPPEQWKSLQLIKPRKVEFVKDEYKSYRWRVNFLDPFWNRYSLKLTDPAAIAALNRGEKLRPWCYLVVSLTEPFAFEDGRQPMCFKLVAGVVEV